MEMTVREYQLKTGLSYGMVLRGIREGTIPARKNGTGYLVSCPDTVSIYTGSHFSREKREYGYAFVICLNGQEIKRGSGAHASGFVRGELLAVLTAIRQVSEKFSDLEIIYGYSGVKDALDDPDPDSRMEMEYAAQMQEALQAFRNVTFLHGSDDRFFRDAARDAKKAVASSASSSGPMVHPECEEKIKDLLQKPVKERKFNDYVSLRTYGPDGYTDLTLTELCKKVSDKDKQIIRARLKESSDRNYASALRWKLRGLPAADAARKVNTDLAVKKQ